MKRCTRCGRRKPLDEFGPHTQTSDGFDSRCRDCKSELAQASNGSPVEGRIECRVCGRSFHALGPHLRAHELDGRAYRRLYPDAPLASDHYLATMRDVHGDRGWVRVWTQGRIIATLKGWAAAHGRSPGMQDWRAATPAHPPTNVVVKRFGNWNNALRAAGLPTKGPGRPRKIAA